MIEDTMPSKGKKLTLDHTYGYCAPSRIPSFNRTGSCYTREEVVTMTELYNKHATHKLPIDPNASIQTLLKQLESAVDSTKATCSKEATRDLCLLEQPFIKTYATRTHDMIRRVAFRPPKPVTWYKNKHEWLNTYNILDVLKQYELFDPAFVALGVVPIDFAKGVGDAQGRCIAPAVCNMRIEDLRAQGKTDFGIVINMDPHTKGGSHWVSAFCHFVADDPKYGICYFDSMGFKPPAQILEFMRSVHRQIQALDPPEKARHFRIKYNPHQKQFQNSECGMFAIAFIITCNENPGLTYADVFDLIQRDSSVFELRNRIFSPNTHS